MVLSLPATPSLDDRTVQGSVKTLYDQVQLHVENFYANVDVKLTSDVAKSLSALQTPYLPDSVASVIASSKTPSPVIKHCLAYMVTQSISVSSGTQLTLLPPVYAAMVTGSNLSTAEGVDAVARRQAFSKWKELTAYFMPDPFKNPESIASRDSVISSMVQIFSDAFLLWDSHPTDEASARQHLVELLRNAADVATMLFAQASAFEFRWQQPSSQDGSKKRSLVVVPACLKVVDDRGQRLERPQGMTQAVMERI
ncbi:hypothetical protein LTR85_011907 [Meristemomyces frigidus]|nr:hypothetical protein LTR85_011907 [Meristemomyces frigidus]